MDKSEPEASAEQPLPWELIEALGQGIAITDGEGNFVYVNPTFCQIVGRTAAELMGLRPLVLTYPDDLEKVKQFGQARRAGESSAYEVRLIKPDNRIVYAHITAVPRWQDGEVKGTYAIVTDQTEKRRVEEELRRNEAYLRMAYEAAEIGIWRNDLLTGEIKLDERARCHLGLDTTTPSREKLIACVHPEDLSRVLGQLKAAALAEEGERVTIEYRVIHPDGTVHWVLVNLQARFSGVGSERRPALVLGTSQDITARKQTELALEENSEKLLLFIEHAPAALAMFDRQMRYLAVSRRWLADFALENQVVLGRSHYETFPEISEEWKAIHRRSMAGEVVKANEDQFVRQDGRIQWLRWEVRPWYMAQGSVGGIVIFSEDITESMEVKEQLHRSETRYRAIVEDQTELIMRSKADGTILFANHAYCRFFKIAPEAIVGQNFYSFLEGGERERLERKIARLAPDNPVEVNEHLESLPDGPAVWVRWVDRGIFNEKGMLLEIQGVGIDITERREAELQLRQSEKRLQQIIDTVPEGVLLLMTDGSIQLSNPVAKEYLTLLSPNLPDNQLTSLGNRSLRELFTSPPKGLWHEIKTEGNIFEAIARPIESGSRNSGWVLVIRNVTQEREIQQQVQQQEQLAAVGQLAAGIAHDFNNIMSVIILYAQLIMRTETLAPRNAEKLDTIEKQAKRATDLIQQILDFSRQSVLERQALDLLPLMKEQVKLLERTLPEHIQLELHYEDKPYVIHADPARIQQVILNLALNARDAMPDGGVLQMSLAQVQVDKYTDFPVKNLPSGQWIHLQIADSGTGMPASTSMRVFEPFFTTKEVGKGSGLGLAQVYGIVQQHEGYIDLVSKPREGTTFHLCFPTLVNDEHVAVQPGDTALHFGNQQVVLLVEDEAATRQAMLDGLLMLGYQVMEAENGRIALDILAAESERIQLVLSDVIMPEMGGVALLHAVREQGLNLPFILMSGHTFDVDVEHLEEVGLFGWLPKPPSLAKLSQMLIQALA